MAASTAKLNNLSVGPRKVRLVVDMIRGKNVDEALNILQFSTKRCARPLAKLVQSAIANADQKGGINIDKLFIHTIFVDGGKVIKRWRPRAMGRATPILKRTSHISVTLEQR
jgi:large subunit ribosomal protein L22